MSADRIGGSTSQTLHVVAMKAGEAQFSAPASWPANQAFQRNTSPCLVLDQVRTPPALHAASPSRNRSPPAKAQYRLSNRRPAGHHGEPARASPCVQLQPSEPPGIRLSGRKLDRSQTPVCPGRVSPAACAPRTWPAPVSAGCPLLCISP